MVIIVCYVIREVLAPGVPSTVERLPDYDAVIEETEVLHEYLVKSGLLPPTNVVILNYTRNVEALFANKLAQELLTTGRDIMKEDLFVTVSITEESSSANPLANVLKEENNTEEKENEEEEELPVPPSFPLPDQLFRFPNCAVSASTVRLMEQAVIAGLEQAAASQQPFCAVRLFNTVRNLFELWCAVVPTYHKAGFQICRTGTGIGSRSCQTLFG